MDFSEERSRKDIEVKVIRLKEVPCEKYWNTRSFAVRELFPEDGTRGKIPLTVRICNPFIIPETRRWIIRNYITGTTGYLSIKTLTIVSYSIRKMYASELSS